MHKVVTMVLIGLIISFIIGMSIAACFISPQSTQQSSTETCKRGQALSVLMKLKDAPLPKFTRAFTLLELMIVIVILGVLASVGIMQYKSAIEKSRGAEARIVIGSLRTQCAAQFLGVNNTTACTNTSLGLGPNAGSIPNGTACLPTNYFWYAISGNSGSQVTFTATRCLGGNGKTPSAVSAGTLNLTTDFSAGTDTWVGTGY
jgi:prepilin-type N-terminal cleavage/methylation domain-containing protein